MSMFLILGASGNLSHALQKNFPKSETVILNSVDIASWIEPGGALAAKTFLANLNVQPKGIFNAAGIINPQASLDQLNMVNFVLPCNLLEASNELEIPLYTFGSIMERDDYCRASNNYLVSKRNFKHFIDDLDIEQKISHLHFLVHTWYGVNKLPEHMFLGQIVRSLREKKIFNMTSGTQMREYHHIQDDMKVVLDLINRREQGTIELNHGMPIELRSLANAIFTSFNCLELLNVDLNISSADESRSNFYKDAYVNPGYDYRDQIEGVTEYVRELLL